MLRSRKGIIILSAVLISLWAMPTHAQTLLIEADGLVKDINKTANTVSKSTIEPVVGLKEQAKAEIEGFNPLGDLQDWYDEQTSALDSWMEDQYNSAASWVSDQFSSSGEPGTGFSSTWVGKGLTSVKDGFQKYGKKVANFTKNLACKIEKAADYTKNLFLGKKNTPDKLSGYDAMDVQKNVKSYVQEATRTMLTDATQVINGTSDFGTKGGDAENINKQANKAKNVKQDIKTVNEMNIGTNVMTNILMSMDVTDLGIQSGLIYEELNNSKNTFLKLF